MALAALAAELSAALDAQPRAASRLAYRALCRDGTVQPWDEEAVRLWEQDGSEDVDDIHHLAVAHHARAYDLEAAGDDAAFAHFEKALACWAQLYDEPEFWHRLRARAAEALEAPVAGDVVDEVRARLPRDLLEVHLTLAARLRTGDPRRAYRHVRLVVGCAFDAGTVAEARHELVREVLDGVPQAITEGRYEDCATALASWLAVDPDNTELLRAWLFTGRGWVEQLYRERVPLRRVDEVLARVEAQARPGLDEVGAMTDELAHELARHECLLGFRTYDTAVESLPSDWRVSPEAVRRARQWADRAAEHIARALELNPELGQDGFYGPVEELRDTELPFLRGQLAVTSARHLLTAARVDDADLVQARRLVEQAAAYRIDDPDFRSDLGTVEELLRLRAPVGHGEEDH
ncbi:hypothetical protein OHR68_41775 [Spirillospora sp. NBC_00431]